MTEEQIRQEFNKQFFEAARQIIEQSKKDLEAAYKATMQAIDKRIKELEDD